MNLKHIAQAKIELIRKQAWDDFYIFAKYVCGRNLMEEEPHREVCEFLTYGLEESKQLGIEFKHPKKVVKDRDIPRQKLFKKLVMLHRGSFKSTIASNAFPLWLLWHNPNLRILIDSETLGNAKLYLAGLKDMIDNNHMIKLICTNKDGDFILEPDRKTAGGFTESAVILKMRTKVGLKEPSIFCAGVDNATTGMHPDVIIMDDLVSERNVGTDTQIMKVNDHYKLSLSLLEPDGLQVVIGTRYHMADLYGELIERDMFDTIIRPAINEEGKVYFPARFSRERLDDLRKEQSSYIFSCQYMLSPIDDSEATFKREHMKYWDKLPEFAHKYMTIDLAISQKETADYTVLMVIGETANKELYVIEYIRQRMKPNETLEAIFQLADKHTFRKIGIETVAFQKAMLYYIKDEARRRGKYLPLVELKADRDKIRRIRSLQPLFEDKKVYIERGMDALERELLEFPYSKHDDCLDALAYILQLLKAGSINQQRREYIYNRSNSKLSY